MHLCTYLSITGFPPAHLAGRKDIANTLAHGAQKALVAAYYTAAGRAADTILSNQNLGGMTLLPGVYKFAGSAALNGKT
jgi:hypothetical protein